MFRKREWCYEWQDRSCSFYIRYSHYCPYTDPYSCPANVSGFPESFCFGEILLTTRWQFKPRYGFGWKYRSIPKELLVVRTLHCMTGLLELFELQLGLIHWRFKDDTGPLWCHIMEKNCRKSVSFDSYCRSSTDNTSSCALHCRSSKIGRRCSQESDLTSWEPSYDVARPDDRPRFTCKSPVDRRHKPRRETRRNFFCLVVGRCCRSANLNSFRLKTFPLPKVWRRWCLWTFLQNPFSSQLMCTVREAKLESMNESNSPESWRWLRIFKSSSFG